MTEFDKKIRELSRNIRIPKDFDSRIEATLQKIPEEERYTKKNGWKNRLAVALMCGLVCFIAVFGGFAIKADASILESFKITIMDLLHISDRDEELGVTSNKEQIESKPDLFLELQEVVTDNQGVYLLVKITAPPDISFQKEISFDYFAFCDGDNYNADRLIGGGRDCYLLETLEHKSNVATYLVSLSANMKEYEGKPVTACFKDLTLDPNGDSPKLLVEGMWSITFVPEISVKESIHLDGDVDMEFPFLDTKAFVNSIDITPLGMTLVSDVSNFPYDELGISDTTISIRLKMVDGSEIPIMPSNPDEEWIVDSGSVEYNQEGDKSLKKEIYSFCQAIDISKIIGIYIQDVFIPLS